MNARGPSTLMQHFFLKSSNYYDKSLDSDNDLLLSVAKRHTQKKKKKKGGVRKGRKEGRKEGREGGGRREEEREKKLCPCDGCLSHVLATSLSKICIGLNLGWQLKMLCYNKFKCLQTL